MPHDVAGLFGNLAFADDLYRCWQLDPSSVDPSWQRFFENGASTPLVPAPRPITNGAGTHPSGAAAYTNGATHHATLTPTTALGHAAGVFSLVQAYRGRGHFAAKLDPLDMLERPAHQELSLAAYGFSDADLDTLVPSGGFHGPEFLPLRELVANLETTYCGSIGVEYLYIPSAQRRRWLAERMESTHNRMPVDRLTQLAILDRLAAAETFERFLHTKYVGTKRFSLEGGETLIPLLDLALEEAGRLGVDEAVIGMAHRGRLNVLANTLNKRPREIFAEFEDLDPESTFGSGDVKYHMGYSNEYVTRGGPTLHLSLAFNPSHLEAVDPVVVGRVRAKQRRRGADGRSKVMGILIHGDAAFAGQGLVAEVLNLSEISGYRTGGTLHVIVNNQIGFTTSPIEGRSTPYATDMAKLLYCPIFHVNGEDPEAVAHVVRLAMEYRAEFRTDVVIDMYCFRRYGHNEADEPAFTQPLLYRRIEQKTPPYRVYAESLVARGVISQAEVDSIVPACYARLEAELAAAKNTSARPVPEAHGGVWQLFSGGADSKVPDVDTGVARALLTQIAERVCTFPDSFHPHPKVATLFRNRLAMGRGDKAIDWGMSEILAYASLVWDGHLVRLSGQDCCRGTFSHRHATVNDVETGVEYQPLNHLHADQGYARIYNSPLSEAGVLGFEFGFSLDYPDGLVIWEAQFGDFVNGAQVIIDQFIASSEDKWKRLSGLVMMLPHGYEGQGPEHSSARPERFLQLCAEDNIQVANPTTPAQMFHLLRRQVLRRWRKPLVVMTPKSLLRHPLATSSLDEFTTGRFARVLGETEALAPNKVTRVMLCSGKVYYDLIEERRRLGDTKTAIVRLEQLYPWHDQQVAFALSPFPKLRELIWVQEEPQNMGALGFVEPRLRRIANTGGARALRMVSRHESASPATGSHKAHVLEQKALLAEAFRG